MSMSTLEIKIDSMTRELESYGHKAIALHATCCAERLIDIYDEYARKEKAGSPEKVRAALDSAWGYLVSDLSNPAELSQWIAILEFATPHADDCRSVECLLSQYVCICVDTAIRYCIGDESVGPVSIEYTFEALRALQCYLQTGHIDLGSGPEADRFEEDLVNSPIVQKELELQLNDLSDIKHSNCVDGQLAEELRKRARANAIIVAQYFGNP